MAKNRQVSAAQQIIRPGEGALVDVVQTSEAKPTGATSVSFGFKFGAAPVPDRKYVADMCCVLPAGTDCKLLFGQERIGSQDLRSLLVVHLSANGIAQFVDSFDNMQKPTLEELVKTLGVEAESLSPSPEEPSQTVALSANLSMAAFAGTEACFDFYQASPFAIVAAPKARKLALDPVVRVETRTTLALGLLSELRKLIPDVIESDPKENEK